MPISTSFIRLFVILSLALCALSLGACEEEATTCTEELACANQDGLVQTCCTEKAEEDWSCSYITPDGKEFACEPILDEVNAGSYCEQAVEELNDYCSE